MFIKKVVDDFFEELSKSKQFSAYGGKCIDIFYKAYDAKKPEDIITYSVQIANEFSARNKFKSELEIGIYIELINEFAHLKGVPKTSEELNAEIYIRSVPDIGISDISKGSRRNPHFEQYVSPLPFKVKGMKEGINCFYREYRLHDEKFDWEEEYTREVFFVV